MKEYIEIHGDQWKLADIQENVEWSKKQVWGGKKYENPNDHEHCLICCWTIFKSETYEDGYGYNCGDSNWLCTECYGKLVKNS